MNCIGRVFEERPREVWSNDGRWCYWTLPPRGSRVFHAQHGNTFALSPDGFEWVLLVDVPVWYPTDRWFREVDGCMVLVPSFENERNARMTG